jgi:hypothetical protein
MRKPVADSSPDPEPERLSLEEQAANLLWHFERRGRKSMARLAELEELSLAVVDTALRRALATLVLRGYSREWICATFTLTRGQLERAARAPPLGEAFEPIGTWRWPPPQAAAIAAEKQALLQEEPEPEQPPIARAAAG